MLMQKIMCTLGKHDYQMSCTHPFCETGFQVRECKCCKFTQVTENDIPWYEISNAEVLKNWKPFNVTRT